MSDLLWQYSEKVLSSKLTPGNDGSTRTAPCGAEAGIVTVVALLATALARAASMSRRMGALVDEAHLSRLLEVSLKKAAPG